MRVAAVVRIVRDPAAMRWDRIEGRLDVEGAGFIMNPSDRAALELAARLADGRFVAIGCGEPAGVSILKEAAAFGASRLLYRSFEADGLVGAQTVLASAVSEERPDVVLAGQSAIDTNDRALAGFLGDLLDGDSCGNVVDANVASDGSLAVTLEDGSTRLLLLPAALGVFAIAARKISPLAMMKATRAAVTVTPAGPVSARATLRAVADGAPRRRRSTILDEGDPASGALATIDLLRERRAL